jgi:hypothetical protein
LLFLFIVSFSFWLWLWVFCVHNFAGRLVFVLVSWFGLFFGFCLVVVVVVGAVFDVGCGCTGKIFMLVVTGCGRMEDLFQNYFYFGVIKKILLLWL